MTSIQHVAPVSAPRRDTEAFAYAPPANHWLRMIYAAWGRVLCLLTCSDGLESEAYTLTDPVDTEALAANPSSKKVLVYNGTAEAAVVTESGAVVALVAPGETRELPTPGLFSISVTTEGAGALVVTRYLRCVCGDEEVTYAAAPVGAFLL